MEQSGVAPTAPFEYVGGELDLFAQATNWKRYVRSRLARYVRGNVLEVGAGIGETTRHLCDGTQQSWLCLEPDAALAARLTGLLDRSPLVPKPRVEAATLADLRDGERFETILYIDVLEHIERDREELQRASELLVAGGSIIVLSPAFQFLYSDFDKSIGHYRRYTKRSLAAVFPLGLQRLELTYLDSVGFLASLANRLLLRQALPTANQILFWDRAMIPISRPADHVFRHAFGRSVVAVYARPGRTTP
jgi:hypothetical protein